MNPIKLTFVSVILAQFVLFEFFVSPALTQQEPSIELPVQLVGFPVIILAVRVSNFVKKLAYALNPGTYSGKSRTKRNLNTNLMQLGENGPLIDASIAEKKLIEEFGKDVCIYEDVCVQNAVKSKAYSRRNRQKMGLNAMDFGSFLKSYERQPEKLKENYLLSVFLGEIIASPDFCKQIGKRERRNCATRE